MDKFYGSSGIGSDKASLLHNKAEKREGEYYPEGTKERQRGNVRGSFIFEINAFSFLQTDGAGRPVHRSGHRTSSMPFPLICRLPCAPLSGPAPSARPAVFPFSLFRLPLL